MRRTHTHTHSHTHTLTITVVFCHIVIVIHDLELIYHLVPNIIIYFVKSEAECVDHTLILSFSRFLTQDNPDFIVSNSGYVVKSNRRSKLSIMLRNVDTKDMIFRMRFRTIPTPGEPSGLSWSVEEKWL